MSIESIIQSNKQKQRGKKKKQTVTAVDQKYTGNEPIWDNWQNWTVDEYMQERNRALSFYAYYSSSKDLKPAVIDWMSVRGYSKEEIKAMNRAPDYYPGLTAGSLCTCMNRGMPSLHPQAQQYHDKMVGVGGIARSDEDFIKEAIQIAIDSGKGIHENIAVSEEENVPVESKLISPMVRLQNKIRSTIIRDLDAMLDRWMDSKDQVEGIKIYEKMREYDLPAQACGQVITWLTKYKDWMTSALDKTDPDLVQGYSYLTAKQLKVRVDVLNDMLDDLNKFKHSAKAERAPREKKLPSAMKQVEKLQYCKQDNDFKITSVNPIRIVGAYRLLAFNSKTRILYDYYAESKTGLLIKGTTLKQVDVILSKCIRLRKPEDVLPMILNGTAKQIDNAWKKLTTKEAKPNGRINEDMVLIRVFENRSDS